MPFDLPDAESARPLALRLRHLRQLHGSTSLGQAQLAVLAGIPVRKLRALETTRKIPESLRAWLALARALRCSVEELVALPTAVPGQNVVVVLRRSTGAVSVCACGRDIIEIRGHGKPRSSALEVLLDGARQFAADYSAKLLTDTRSGFPAEAIATTTYKEVAEALGLHDARLRSIAAYALTAVPALRRHVRISRRTGWLSPFDRRGPLVLLAAGIALAQSVAPAAAPTGEQLDLPFHN